jgi:hypothetical protein
MGLYGAGQALKSAPLDAVTAALGLTSTSRRAVRMLILISVTWASHVSNMTTSSGPGTFLLTARNRGRGSDRGATLTSDHHGYS